MASLRARGGDFSEIALSGEVTSIPEGWVLRLDLLLYGDFGEIASPCFGEIVGK